MSTTIPAKQTALVVPVAYAPFEIQEIDVPKPGAGEVLVRAESVGLNPADWAIREYDFFKSAYPLILGCEAAGTVLQVGEGVTSLAVGDKVYHAAWFESYPGFRQYNVAPVDICVKIPSNFTIDQAAAVPLAFNTALIGMYCPPENRGGAGIAPFWQEGGRGKYAGQPILILGGSASVSQPAIQFARLSGFSPIITTASLKNAPLLKSLGATHVLDRSLSGEAFTSAVREILAGKALSVIYDGVSGPEIQQAAYEVLAPGGIFVGCTGGRHLTPEQQASKEKQVVFTYGSPLWEDRREMCKSFFKVMPTLFENGELKPNSIEVIPGGWNGAIAGLKRMQEGGVSARKLIIHPHETA